MPNGTQTKTRPAKLDFGPYKYGFSDRTADYAFAGKAGLSRRVVEEISSLKGEPNWMREFRLRAYDIFTKKAMPTWGADLFDIHFDAIRYFMRATDSKARTWADVPKTIKDTFDKLGVPEAERKFFAGVAAQYDAEVVYHNMRKEWEEHGVIFVDTDTAVQKYPDLVRRYFSTIVPPADNKFAALNSAVWSGGSFVYVPAGVHVQTPLQAYFRINAKNVGQFERTLIIAEEGSFVHYIEGCFARGALITTNPAYKPIETVRVGDRVLTHTGQYRRVYHVQERPYRGKLYTIEVYGDTTQRLEVTEEHPFLYAKCIVSNERNGSWEVTWGTPKELARLDYLAIPINRIVQPLPSAVVRVPFRGRLEDIVVPSTPEFFRLAGYFLAEGSVDDRGYIHLSFDVAEKAWLADAKRLFRSVFGVKHFHELIHAQNHGVSLIVSSAKLARAFAQLFGDSAVTRRIPQWMLLEALAKQKQLVLGYFRGDGNYYCQQNKHGRKEIFRLTTVSPTLARQVKDLLPRFNIVASLNKRIRTHEGRQTMYSVCIGGEYAVPFGKLVGQRVVTRLNEKKRATIFGLDDRYAYVPIKRISQRFVKNVPVYNFSVEGDESYVAGGVAVHNCTAPVYTTDSLHSAVVEIIVKKNARVRYTTVQNWSNNVYNLVTKRAFAHEDAVMEWVDGNLGSKITMKYPSVFLMGRGAKADILSIAFAGRGQHQDAGGKVMHLAPETTSQIISKSISNNGGRTSYRGIVKIARGAAGAKSKVKCDALILDPRSHSDTYPAIDVDEDNAVVEHEATASRLNEEQLFYLQSRGLPEAAAATLIVSGFIEPFVKELPLDYAVEMNKLIQMQMEGSVG